MGGVTFSSWWRRVPICQKSASSRDAVPNSAASSVKRFGHGPRRQIVEMAAGLRGNALIGLAGIFADPLAIGMVAERIDAVRRELAADLGIADDAGGQRHVQVEQIAGRAAIQHEAGIGDGRLMLGGGLEVLRDSPQRPHSRTCRSISSRMAARPACAARMSASVRLL